MPTCTVLASFPCVYRDSYLVLFYFKSSLMLIPPCFTGVVPSPPFHPTTWTRLPASHVSNLLCLFVSRYVRSIAFRFDALRRPHVDDSAPQASKTLFGLCNVEPLSTTFPSPSLPLISTSPRANTHTSQPQPTVSSQRKTQIK